MTLLLKRSKNLRTALRGM